MAYTEKQIEDIFEYVCKEIENNRPLRRILMDENTPSSKTFYEWLDNDEKKVKRYARACEIRSEIIFDEMFDIADDGTNDFVSVDIGEGVEVQKLNTEHLQRSRLRIDTRKWVLSKMNPKKYGDKVALEHESPKGTMSPNTIIDLSNLTDKELLEYEKLQEKIEAKK
jgi:hypothetical protein